MIAKLSPEEAREERKKREQDRETVDLFKSLVKHEGWKRYIQILNNQIAERTVDIFAPTPAGETLKSEHNKGTVFGVLYCRDVVPTIIAANEQIPSPTEEDDEP